MFNQYTLGNFQSSQRFLKTEHTLKAGKVYAHVGQKFSERVYDVVVIGGGRMGLACAFYLRQFRPDLRVLILEQEGIPSENSATFHAPGVWHSAHLPTPLQAQAAWVRQVWLNPAAETGIKRPYDPSFQTVGWLHCSLDPSNTTSLDKLPITSPAQQQLASLLDLSQIEGFTFDSLGGYGHASTLALSYGYGAVRLGADLMLGVKANLTPGGVEIERLDITSTMEIVTAEVIQIKAEHVVLAAGSASLQLLKQNLGIETSHSRTYQQYPLLHSPAAKGLPVVHCAGFTVRPYQDTLRIVPPLASLDLTEEPLTGGRLMDVPLGLRDELIERMLAILDIWPAFASSKLNVGKTVGSIAGSWVTRPQGGWPLWEKISDKLFLLLGGPEADRVGLAVALDLAGNLSDEAWRPWLDR